jgi:hypothetical protein
VLAAILRDAARSRAAPQDDGGGCCDPLPPPSLRAQRSNPALVRRKESWIASSQVLLAMTVGSTAKFFSFTQPAQNGEIIEQIQQIDPTGKSLRFTRKPSQAPPKKIFRFSEVTNQSISTASRSTRRGVSRTSRTWGWAAVDAEARETGDAKADRRNRVVPTPQGQVSSSRQVARATVAKVQGSPRRARISRKLPRRESRIASAGPVCSCAPSTTSLHTRPRVQRASGFPCAL